MHVFRAGEAARLLAANRDRVTRRALAGLLAALGLGAPISLFGARGKRKRKNKHKKKRRGGCRSCGLCRKCRKERCRPRRDGVECGHCGICLGGRCVSACPAGQRCSGEVCAVPPSCFGRDAFCTEPAACCSGNCNDDDGNGVFSCACSDIGQPCSATGDCCAGRCVGFVCVS